MKAFFIGLACLAGIGLLGGLMIVLYPLLFALAFLLRVAVIIGLFVFGTWALGKCILYIGEFVLDRSKGETGKKRV